MKNLPLPRLDRHAELRHRLLQYCRLQAGEIWTDPLGKHRLGCLDAADPKHIKKLMDGNAATLSIHDPPYNLVAFEEKELSEYIAWCKQWIENTDAALTGDSSLYVWLGAEDSAGNGSCSLQSVSDPTKCPVCTPVQACLNKCETCELCIGKPQLPASCTPQSDAGDAGGCPTPSCPSGEQPCGTSCLPKCPDQYFCLTGCCIRVP
jgi:hypothetical protein